MMFANGEVPFGDLIHLGANHWLPPGTFARWNWAVTQAKAKYGVTLRITPDRDGLGGWNAYRPRSAQVLYKKHYGSMAAAPGYSTHGGNVRGVEVFAIDVDNWAELGWDRFSAIMRLAGFTVNFVSPEELWHVGDFNNPWAVPAFASGGGGSAVFPPAPRPVSQTGVPGMFIFYSGTLSPSNAYLASYDGRVLKVRPTVGVEATALIAAQPPIPRVQLTGDQVVDLCAQGGYVFKNGVGYYDGVPSYRPGS